tara:strand:- start:1098 stop:1361 length:264 start_codon:yes stop_codon:yes gene_type:complete
MVTKLKLTYNLKKQQEIILQLEIENKMLKTKNNLYEKFVNKITELESPNGHFGRLSAPIVLEKVIDQSKDLKGVIKNVEVEKKRYYL